MNRFTRMLTMAGLGLATTVTLGAAPALASTSTEQGTAQAQASSDPWFGNDRVVGFFRSYGICDRAGEFGEDDGWWEDYDCVRVRSGFQNRRYALVVDYDEWGHGYNGHFGSWAGQWWPGHHRGWWGHGNGNDNGGNHHCPPRCGNNNNNNDDDDDDDNGGNSVRVFGQF